MKKKGFSRGGDNNQNQEQQKQKKERQTSEKKYTKVLINIFSHVIS